MRQNDKQKMPKWSLTLLASRSAKLTIGKIINAIFIYFFMRKTHLIERTKNDQLKVVSSIFTEATKVNKNT